MQSSNENLSKQQRKELKARLRLEKELASSSIVNPEDKFNVLCVRFGNRYGVQYVEKLRNMVERHLSIPYEFVCLTDDNRPIRGVRSIVQKNAGYQKGWWHKVHMFDPSLDISGRILYFDLDVIIHGKIDKLLTVYKDKFLGIQDFNRKFHPNWQYLNSSVMVWNHREQSHIWTEFKKNPQAAMKMPGDQDWIWKTSKDRIKWFPKDWIQSYKWEIRKREELIILNGKRKFRETRDDITPSKECCVAVFHGDPKPEETGDKFVLDNWY